MSESNNMNQLKENEAIYLDGNDLITFNDQEGGIHSGGFSVKTIMMKAGMSPITTINYNQFGGNFNKVSDLFNDLVVPNWALSYNNLIVGGKYKEVEYDSDDDVIDDDLHSKLLELVKEHNVQVDEKEKEKIPEKPNKRRLTRKFKRNSSNKRTTKRLK